MRSVIVVLFCECYTEMIELASTLWHGIVGGIVRRVG